MVVKLIYGRKITKIMIKISHIIDAIEQLSPSYTQESWDNCGVQVGNVNQECLGAVIALDISMDIVEQAIKSGANLIITHHPLLFSAPKSITPDTREGALVIKLIQNDIVVYSAHTSIDKAEGGINSRLAEMLDLQEVVPLDEVSMIGCVGNTKGIIDYSQLLGRLEKSLPISNVRKTLGIEDMKFDRIALCGGSGGSLIKNAIAAKAQVYITGDLKYSHFVEFEGQILLIDIGHFESEVQFCDILLSFLSNIFPNFAIQTITKNPFH